MVAVKRPDKNTAGINTLAGKSAKRSA